MQTVEFWLFQYVFFMVVKIFFWLFKKPRKIVDRYISMC